MPGSSIRAFLFPDFFQGLAMRILRNKPKETVICMMTTGRLNSGWAKGQQESRHGMAARNETFKRSGRLVGERKAFSRGTVRPAN
ncbi:hypothetical protein GR158_01410 [Shinella sp. AETb1-6]|jgi:hypothetical protein|uniref:hypothetical protein n=1 Tax=Shinella TaxID=323620 RepID=UPI00136D63E7|nr:MULTISPECIES: hypothetical protein [Shinella]MXN49759.1 hypothetical protein [Shinella sp. AETb1-6]UPA23379.1 hypothetical protein K6301_09225 [Shinella oryzae]